MALNIPQVRALLTTIIEDAYIRLVKGDTADVQTYKICDEATDNYLILLVGWDVTGRVLGPCVHFRIHNGKIWLEEDTTDLEVGVRLLEAGIANDDIVLGFLDPEEERPYSAYAVA